MSEEYDFDAEFDCDWFDKYEEELLQNLENKLKTDASPTNEEENEEGYIECSTSAVDSYFRERRLSAAGKSLITSKLCRINTAELRRISKAEPLEAFIFIYTNKPANFFLGQILPNDEKQRIIFYLRIYAAVCELNVPYFHHEILFQFTQNVDFLQRIEVIFTKLITKRSKKNDDNNFLEETRILEDIRFLFLQAYKEGLVNEKCYRVLTHFYVLLKENNGISTKIKELAICREFRKEIFNMKESEKYVQPIYHEILPTLVELLEAHKAPESLPNVEKNDFIKYIEQQQYMLREEFLAVMRKHVKKLQKNDNKFSELLVVGNVHIKCNLTFVHALRHEHLFVDLLGSRREDETTEISTELYNKLLELKTGTLLCFTSSLNFENLVYAVYHSTNTDAFKKGFICIQILKQYNIGNIYDKQLFMFEAPLFYVTYKQTYENLKYFANKNDELPFQRYLINKEQDIQSPAYEMPLKYAYENSSFTLNKEDMPKEILQLNDMQLQAYENALKQELCLIQGPPGTGKTHLSVKLVRTLMENLQNTPIVLITYKNDALDKFLLKLLEHTQDFVRFGTRTRLDSLAHLTERNLKRNSVLTPGLKELHNQIMMELKDCLYELIQLQLKEEQEEEKQTYENIAAAQHRLNIVYEKLNCIHSIFQYCLARKKRLIAMTTTCAAKMQFCFKLLQSAVVIFEEAAEIQESHAIACLTSFAKHVIMIGDHQQLQPFTGSHEHKSCWKLNISLFERLINQGLPYVQLTEQYRMRASIAELLTPCIYKTLHNAPFVLEYENVRQMRENLFFVNHHKIEIKNNDENWICNDFEVEKLSQLVEYLIKEAKYSTSDIVILSPYAKQVDNLQRKLRQIDAYQCIRIDTVDSFQGSEANIVLLSLVRSNENKIIGFLKDSHRICVALSRARKGLYIIGNLDLLASVSNIWKSIMEKLTSRNSIGTEFPYECSTDN